jgi:hypothetical protein
LSDLLGLVGIIPPVPARLGELGRPEEEEEEVVVVVVLEEEVEGISR